MLALAKRGLRRVPDYFRRRRSSSIRLSVDIGSRHIKVIESERRGADIWISKALCFETPAGAVTNQVVSDVDAVANAVRRALETAGVTATRALTCIPGPSAMIKRGRLPLGEAERLDAFVRNEIENLTSCGAEALRVDHQVSEIHLEEALEVLVVAARPETVNTYVEALERAGLGVEVVDVDYLALENMFAANHEAEASRTIALVHLGARFCALTIQSHGSWRVSGNVAVGTDAAAAGDAVAMEIDRALRFYWPASAGDRIDEVVLSGGGAALLSIDRQLAARIGCSVRYAEPFNRMKFASPVAREDICRSPASFAIAAGLAVRSLEEP